MCTSETEATRPAAANVVLSHHHLLVFPPFLHATGHMVLAKSRNTLVPMARNYFSRNILLCACVTYVCARERALLSFLLVVCTLHTHGNVSFKSGSYQLWGV